MRRQRWFLACKLLLVTLLFVVLLAPEWPNFQSQNYLLHRVIHQRYFDFLVWELQAFAAKGEAILSGGHRYLDPAARKALVLDYLETVQESNRLRTQIDLAYSNPDIADPAVATQALQSELASRRASLARRQLLVEAVVQEQVAAVLADQDFTLLGNAFPPVLMHVTPLPQVLVTSHRDRIEKVHQISLVPGLTIPAMNEIETAVHDDLDLSALIVPIGGAGTYPSMITETSSINWLLEVTAHEWVHHWLTLRPLGMMYPFDPDIRIVNETVASIVGREIGEAVVDRYYPEFVLPPPPPQPEGPLVEPSTAFDFRAEMAATRVRVDELLADGEIEAAESYMEQRRLEFVANGFTIRKLNQAYFAFYGAYAADPAGAQGNNPIGPMLRDIRQRSPSVLAFLETIAPITSFDDLQAVHARVTAAAPATSAQ